MEKKPAGNETKPETESVPAVTEETETSPTVEPETEPAKRERSEISAEERERRRRIINHYHIATTYYRDPRESWNMVRPLLIGAFLLGVSWLPGVRLGLDMYRYASACALLVFLLAFLFGIVSWIWTMVYAYWKVTHDSEYPAIKAACSNRNVVPDVLWNWRNAREFKDGEWVDTPERLAYEEELKKEPLSLMSVLLHVND